MPGSSVVERTALGPACGNYRTELGGPWPAWRTGSALHRLRELIVMFYSRLRVVRAREKPKLCLSPAAAPVVGCTMQTLLAAADVARPSRCADSGLTRSRDLRAYAASRAFFSSSGVCPLVALLCDPHPGAKAHANRDRGRPHARLAALRHRKVRACLTDAVPTGKVSPCNGPALSL